jgi:hypothetical protein
LGEDLSDLVVVRRWRDVDLDRAIDHDRSHLLAQTGFSERVTRSPLGGPAA